MGVPPSVVGVIHVSRHESWKMSLAFADVGDAGTSEGSHVVVSNSRETSIQKDC